MHVHLDLMGGLAGDMFLAAALDCGLVERAEIEQALSSLGFGEISIIERSVRRGAIQGTHVAFEGWPPEAESDHRHLTTIIEILEGSDLPSEVCERAVSMFRVLGRAESDVHGIPLEDVHFHECGALDSIFDFVSAAWIIEQAGVESWSCGAVPLGSGTVETDHGTVPVPVPATAKLLDGFETVTRDVDVELVTPTGATILRTLREISPELQRPSGKVAADGFGAGTRDVEQLSNVVRMFAIETERDASETGLNRDEVVQLVTEIDDMSPEILADVEEVLFEAGALDVVREPVGMKKGRQGVRLSVLGRPDDEDMLVDTILRHTTTFGIRRQSLERWVLDREMETVETEYGEIGVKLGRSGGEILRVTPEFDECRAAARHHGVPVERVYGAAKSTAERRFNPAE